MRTYVITPQNGSELCHYGVLGMKWGVRRYQSYDQKPRKSGKGGKEIGTAKKNSKSSNSGSGIRLPNKLQKYANQKMDSGLEEQLIGLGVETAIMLLLMGGLAIHRAVTKKSYMKELKNELYNNRPVKTIEELPKSKSKKPPAENCKETNPGFPSKGRDINCALCTTAMVMREKGYDVQAQTSKHGWYTKDLLAELFPGSEEKKMDRKQSPDDMKKTLASEGDGAYGNISVQWKSGGGHSMFWKNENGKTHIYCGQSGLEMDMKSNSAFFKSINMYNVRYSRLDNIEPSQYFLGVIEPSKK